METSLAKYRKAAKISLEALGDQIGVNKSTIHRWEQQTVPIPLNKLAKLTAITGLPREELRPDIFGEAA